MHRVARDDMASQVEFLQQLLHGGDFVGLFVDLDMRQHQRRMTANALSTIIAGEPHDALIKEAMDSCVYSHNENKTCNARRLDE
jgi:hypothetical protein